MTTEASTLDWWTRWPDLYQQELDAFARHGATITSDSRQRGFVLLEVDWPGPADPVRLRVGFSPLHPFCRPAVAAPDLLLERHQNPFTRALCLLTQESGEWTGRDRVADMIARQLPRIEAALEARRGEQWDYAAALEEAAPDPITRYYAADAEQDSAIFFADRQAIPNGTFGKTIFRVQNRTVIGDPQPFEAVLTKVLPVKGTWLAPPFDLPPRMGDSAEIPGRWVRLPLPLPHDPEQLLALADAEIDRLIGPQAGLRAEMARAASAPFAITAILVPEELDYGTGRQGNGWLFVVSRNGKRRKRTAALIAGHRISDDMFSRLPIAGALRSKSAFVVGCGAIGAFVTVELARAGIGEVTFCDYDLVEPGNTVRWPLGRSAWGLRKTVALQDFLVRNYPFTRTVALNGHLGGATTDAGAAAAARENPVEEIRRAIARADVVIDASASTECQHALAFLTREAGKPFVVGYGTLGAVGGVVGRFPVGSPACFVCLHEHWEDGTLPKPAVDETGTVLPVGCNAPTFAGGAFDLQEVSLEMVRSAIGLMTPEAYDPGDWQVSTLTLREEGRRVLPRWTADSLARHPRCTCAPA